MFNDQRRPSFNATAQLNGRQRKQTPPIIGLLMRKLSDNSEVNVQSALFRRSGEYTTITDMIEVPVTTTSDTDSASVGVE